VALPDDRYWNNYRGDGKAGAPRITITASWQLPTQLPRCAHQLPDYTTALQRFGRACLPPPGALPGRYPLMD